MAEKVAKKPEAKKPAKKPNFFVRAGRGIARFFRDTKGEMKKVVWPSRKQVLNNLLVVAVFVIVLAVIIFILDWFFVFLLNGSLNLAAGNGFTGATSSAAVSSVTSEISSVASEVASVVSSVA